MSPRHPGEDLRDEEARLATAPVTAASPKSGSSALGLPCPGEKGSPWPWLGLSGRQENASKKGWSIKNAGTFRTQGGQGVSQEGVVEGQLRHRG